MSNYSYCRIQPEVLLYDTDRDLLAIAKVLVLFDEVPGSRFLDHYSINANAYQSLRTDAQKITCQLSHWPHAGHLTCRPKTRAATLLCNGYDYCKKNFELLLRSMSSKFVGNLLAATNMHKVAQCISLAFGVTP